MSEQVPEVHLGAEDGFESGPDDGTLAAPALRQWQTRALREWRQANRRGIVEAITGTGKSIVGVVAIHETVVINGGNALVLVPTKALVDQWVRTLRSCLPTIRIGMLTGSEHSTFRHADVIVATVQSAYKAPPLPISLGLLVADEVHRYGSGAFSKALDGAYERRLGLTGTLERQLDDGVAARVMPYFGSVTTRYGYSAALKDEVVAPFHLALVPVDFRADEQVDYQRASDRCSDAMKDLVDLFDYPTDWQLFFSQVSSRVGEKNRDWDDEHQLCSAYMSGFAERRRLTSEAAEKEEFAAGMAEGMASLSGTLVFTETKASAQRLAYLINRFTPAFPLSSDSSAAQREEKIRSFASGRLKVLCAPRILDEGIDVPEAELALVVAASQTARQMIQRMGRVIRLKDDGRAAKIMVLYVRGTSEDPERDGHLGFLEQVRPFAISELSGDSRSPSQMTEWLTQ